jgi:hypothetical protein
MKARSAIDKLISHGPARKFVFTQPNPPQEFEEALVNIIEDIIEEYKGSGAIEYTNQYPDAAQMSLVVGHFIDYIKFGTTKNPDNPKEKNFDDVFNTHLNSGLKSNVNLNDYLVNTVNSAISLYNLTNYKYINDRGSILKTPESQHQNCR